MRENPYFPAIRIFQPVMSQKLCFGSPCHKYSMTTLDKPTTWKKVHYFSGVTLAIFIGFHLLNQLLSLDGPALHIAWMERFRMVYRHPVIESLILAAVAFQFVTGIR